MVYRPDGVLAAKIHLKHIAVATTEGCGSRPGGAQAEPLAEVNKYENDRNLGLVLAEFHNYQQGICPAALVPAASPSSSPASTRSSNRPQHRRPGPRAVTGTC
ncbi:hypothetical protein ACFY0G_45265 [Streptomyces sp. NPDC001552]|uniref:hypothetical protein n=1 Tax=Streptomyces sp. NPDC001552 TaxID=3364587 RepID=UPI0036D049A6